MRILVLSTWFPYPPDNGSRTRAFHLLKSLAGSHQVTLVAFRPASGSPPFAAPQPEIEIYPVPVDPFRWVSMPQVFKFASPIPVAFWPSTVMRQTVAQVARLDRWDVVVALQTYIAQYALQLPGVPRVLDVDTAMSFHLHERHLGQITPGRRMATWVSWQKAYQYETRLFRQFQLCAVVSSPELDYVGSMLDGTARNVVVVPNGMDCQHNHLDLVRPDSSRLVFNGSLTYSANYDAMHYFLTQVYPLIRQRVPDVSLTITGSTSGVNLSGLRLDETVHLSGYLEDVRPAVAEAAVCVVPLREGGGTRLKILEAMALGTPVVATRKGAEGLEVVDGQHVLLADSPEAFADRVLQLLRDPASRLRLAANARRLVERRYDWVNIGRQFVGLVEDLVARHQRKEALS